MKKIDKLYEQWQALQPLRENKTTLALLIYGAMVDNSSLLEVSP